MSWTKFVRITEVFEIPHAISEKTRNKKWRDITMAGKTGGLKGANLLKNNPHLHQHDTGIYWIKITLPSSTHESESWNYIGKCAKFSGDQTAQIGIAGRVTEHINKMQNWPRRGDIEDALLRKRVFELGFNEDSNKNKKKFKKKIEELEQEENALIEKHVFGLGFKKDSKEKKKLFKKEVNKLKNQGNRLIEPFKNKIYSDYQAFRDNLSHEGKETYHLEKEFRKFFHSFKEHFKNHETTKKFFENNVKVCFIKLPLDNYKREYFKKIEEYKRKKIFYALDVQKIKLFEEKIRGCSDEQKANEMKFYLEVNQDFDSYVEKAEALCIGAFYAKEGKLPELNNNDETKGFLKGFDENYEDDE
ncbi:hypothetical protein OAE49_01530 [Gammaproteobacteria bacterium]|nr:hypothetical protein [Gammaproteobacteria bacterium]